MSAGDGHAERSHCLSECQEIGHAASSSRRQWIEYRLHWFADQKKSQLRIAAIVEPE